MKSNANSLWMDGWMDGQCPSAAIVGVATLVRDRLSTQHNTFILTSPDVPYLACCPLT